MSLIRACCVKAFCPIPPVIYLPGSDFDAAASSPDSIIIGMLPFWVSRTEYILPGLGAETWTVVLVSEATALCCPGSAFISRDFLLISAFQMGNFIYQSTLVQAGFYREIPVERLNTVKRKAPDIASWGSTTTKPWVDSDSYFEPDFFFGRLSKVAALLSC